jgi:hypothetical protein
MIPRQERVHVLAAFGDIRGFGSYTQRITDDQSQIIPFLSKYDDVVMQFEARNDYFLKHLGDGFLCVAKTNGEKGVTTVRFLSDLWELLGILQRLISRTKSPRPDGYRVRVAAGHVYQAVRLDGSIDFRGYHINLAAKMLQIEKEKHPFVVHESAKQLMSKSQIERAGLRFKLLPPPELRRHPDGIYKKDMEELWAMTTRK